MKEMNSLSQELASPNTANEIFANDENEKGNQIIINLVWGKYFRDFWAEELVSNGFVVIMPDGLVISNSFIPRKPVTIIYHKNIHNDEIKKLVSQLNGTTKKAYFSDYPDIP
ncbi:MAG: hypothetical protein AAB116_02375, partial [Candidatus Poribacteria bacterium]